MPEYLAPGVYVEEVPSAIRPIAGVSTSTAGFIGIVADELCVLPTGPKTKTFPGTAVDGVKTDYDLDDSPVCTTPDSYQVLVDGNAATGVTLQNAGGKSTVVFSTAPAKGKAIEVTYQQGQIFNPVAAAGSSGFQGATLCTNFTEYTNAFGTFSCDPGHRKLTHAVYGFFNNGGTRCYVVRLTSEDNIDAALSAFELVDEIAMVAAPGLSSANTRSKLVTHCSTTMRDRFAILDGPGPDPVASLDKLTTNGSAGMMPAPTDYAAWYFPWIKVFDPVAKKCGSPDGIIAVPPSGHIAGIYARVDNDRGVHKAPANEVIMGALDVTQRLSKAHQGILNPKGVNCIRVLNDNILVWGARTIGEDNAVKYINVRRTLLFLRKSIDEGTQWVVFEPNSPALWQKITRNVTAFLTDVWRSGALFGNTPQEAFYVKCDKETNPQSAIDNGQVVTEIGVAIVRPAEFVIFRISQMAGPGA